MAIRQDTPAVRERPDLGNPRISADSVVGHKTTAKPTSENLNALFYGTFKAEFLL